MRWHVVVVWTFCSRRFHENCFFFEAFLGSEASDIKRLVFFVLCLFEEDVVFSWELIRTFMSLVIAILLLIDVVLILCSTRFYIQLAIHFSAFFVL